MAKDKKVFSVKINGLSDSVEAVKSLTKELDTLETKINSLSKAKINIKVNTDQVDNTVKKVQTTTGQDALSKLEAQYQREKEKSIQLQNDEYRKQLQLVNELKNANKEQQNIIKQQADGVRDVNGNYTQTFGAMKAQLSELKKMKDKFTPDDAEFKSLSEQIKNLNSEISRYEQQMGIFSRNVGNYPSGAKELVELFRQLQEQLKLDNQEVIKLNAQLNNAAKGSDEYNNIKNRLDQLDQSIKNTNSDLSNLQNQLKQKIQINVGGEERYFDNTRQAVKDLTAELQRLYIEGKTGTKQFDDTIKALGRVKTAVTNVNSEIQSFVGNNKGLRDTITMMQGFTSIAGIGQGINMLFGGDTNVLSESIQKFTALTLLANNLNTVLTQTNDTTNIFGRSLNKLWSGLGKLFGGFFPTEETKKLNDEITGLIEKINKFRDLRGLYGEMPMLVKNQFKKITETLNETALNADELRIEFEQIFNARGFDKLKTQFLPLFDELKNKFGESTISVKEFSQHASTYIDRYLAEQEKLVEEGTKQREEINKIIASQKGLAKWYLKANANLKGINGSLNVFTLFANQAVVWTTRLIFVLKQLASATIILGLVQIAIEGLSKVTRFLGNLFSEIFGINATKSTENVDRFADAIETAKNKLESFNRELNRLKAEGEITNLESISAQFTQLSINAEEAGKALQEFIAASEKMQDTLSNDKGASVWSLGIQDDIEKVTKQYNEYLTNIDNGKDHWWNFNKNAQKVVAIQKAAIQDLAKEINNIDFSQGEKAYKQFLDLINTELYSSALANIDELFPKEKWAKGLKDRINEYRDFAQQMYDINTSLIDNCNQNTDKIIDNWAEAIADANERATKQRQIAREREIKAAGDDMELIASINAKYDRQEKDAAKQRNDQLKNESAQRRQIRYREIQSEIDLMNDGLEKQKKQIELQKQQAVDNARAQGDTRKTILNLIEKYDREIIKVEKDFNKSLENILKERDNLIVSMYDDYVQRMKDLKNEIAGTTDDIKRTLLSIEDENFIDTLDFSFDTDKYFENLDKIYQKHRQTNDELFELTKAELQREYDASIESETQRYTALLNEYDKYIKEQEDKLSDAVEKGYITQKEADESLKDIKRQIQTQIENDARIHADKLISIDKDAKAQMIKAENDYANETKRINAELTAERIQQYQNEIAKFEEIRSRSQEKNTSIFGIQNFNKERESLKTLYNQYKQMFDKLKTEKETVKNMFDAGEISTQDFKEKTEQITSMMDEVSGKAIATGKEIKEQFPKFAQDVLSYAQKVGQSIAEIFNTLNQIATMQIENEERRLDHEKEMLDEHLDTLSEYYDKYQEMVEDNKDKVNSIEDELTEARGERREHLIDALLAERNEMIENFKKQQEIEKAEEEAEKKKKKIEEEQKRLEKERNLLNQKNQISQAIMSTASAVANALSIQPFWLGLAMSAVASAMGAAQVATIRRQKFYSDGGILDGASHANGGIPVGNTGIEVEGGEYVINKNTTAQNTDLLEFINSSKKALSMQDMARFYNGNTPDIESMRKMQTVIVDNNQAQYVVSVVDIINKTNELNTVKALAGVK